MHDLAVIVVSHDQERWLPRCLSTLLEHGQGSSLDLVVVDNGDTGAARAGRARLPAGPSAREREPRLRPRLQPGRRDLRCALAAVPEPGHGGAGRLAHGARGRTGARDRDRRRPPARRQRRAHPHDAPVPLRVESPRRLPRPGAFPAPSRLARRARAAARALRPRVRGRLDDRLVSAHPARGVRCCRRLRRALLPLLGRGRPLPAGAAGRLEGRPQPGRDDPPPRQLRPPGRPPPADTTRLGPAAVRGQEPAGRLAAGLSRGAGPALRAPRAARRDAAARGRAGGDRAPPRPQAAAVREPQARSTAGRAPCAGTRAGRDRRHRRLGNAGAGGDRAARRDVRRLGSEPLTGRARLRRVLRPLGRARARARGGSRAPRAGRPPARRGRRPALGLEGAAQRLPAALPGRRAARPAVPARRPRRPRHGPLREPGAAPQTRRRGARSVETSRRSCARSRSGARSTCERPTSANASSETATCASASRISARSRRPRSRRFCASSGSTATPSGSPPRRCGRPRRSAAGARRIRSYVRL